MREDLSGETPKIEVRDARRVTWKVKLGPEAQAEIVATRLVWSVGYFADEAYYLRRVRILNMPRLSRSCQFLLSNSTLSGARLEPDLIVLQSQHSEDLAILHRQLHNEHVASVPFE